MPNTIIETKDGSHSLQSEQFGVSYHSIHGAIQESQHVFIDAGLHFKAIQQDNIAILEIGLGSGLNAFMTYLESKKQKLHINYVGLEAFPLNIETSQQLNYPKLLAAETEQQVFNQLHELPWDKKHKLSDYFSFEKRLQDFQEHQDKALFDVIYFDAFAPDAQPELWDIPFLTKMYNSLCSNGILVTYCAKGVFKRNLKQIGFEIEAIPGPPGKREMTRAIRKK